MEFDEEMKEEVWECHNQQGVSTHFFFLLPYSDDHFSFVDPRTRYEI